MREPSDRSAVPAGAGGDINDRILATAGLATLVAEAETVWRTRAQVAGAADDSDVTKPGWRTFEDAFPTFYEFTNRPR